MSSRPQRSSFKAFREVAILLSVLFVFGFHFHHANAFLTCSPSGSVAARCRLPFIHYRHQSWQTVTLHRNDPGLVRKTTGLCARYWEGDDIRWQRKLRRRFARIKGLPPARTILVLLNLSFFVYQVVNAIGFIRRRHPAYWPSHAVPIVADVLLGRSITGPFTRGFAHTASLSRHQPHRYLTAGFLHGSLLHLVVNLDSLIRIPMWVETGLGWPLYMTAYLAAVVTGNIAHGDTAAFCLGASGGICGLYGLMLSAAQKMGNTRASSNIIRGMMLLLFYGAFLENISNAAHIGGFFGGLIVGYLCGPGYRKSYSMRRKWSLDVDEAPSDYRRAMGFGVVPTKRGLVPLQLLWAAVVFAFVTQPKLQTIPRLMFQGFLHPGSLSGIRTI